MQQVECQCIQVYVRRLGLRAARGRTALERLRLNEEGEKGGYEWKSVREWWLDVEDSETDEWCLGVLMIDAWK